MEDSIAKVLSPSSSFCDLLQLLLAL